MTHVEAVYEDGVFRPMTDVALPERQRVHLTIDPIRAEEAPAWVQRVQQRRQRLLEEHGCFPDSTADIAEDRRR